MNMRHYIRIVLSLSLALACAEAHARIGSLPDVEKLTDDSNLVIVADVASVRDLRSIGFPDHTQGQQVSATLIAKEVLKGSLNTNILDVIYDNNPNPMSGPWTPNLRTGDHMLLFLHCETTCSFTSLEHSGVRVTDSSIDIPHPQGTAPFLRVIQRLGVGLFVRVHAADSNDASDDVPELWVISEQRNISYVDVLLEAALNELTPNQHPNLRGELLAILVRRGKLSLLPQVQQALDSNTGNVQAQTNMVYALQEVDWRVSLPIAAEALRSTSPQVRSAAARAIQNLRQLSYKPPPNELTGPATHILLSALDDPDAEVGFAVMQSLGFLNSRLDERPATSSPDANWSNCLRFWKAFPDPE